MNKKQLIEWKNIGNRGDGGWTTKHIAGNTSGEEENTETALYTWVEQYGKWETGT